MPVGNKPSGRASSASEATPLVMSADQQTPKYLCIRERWTAVAVTLTLVMITAALKEGTNGLLGATLPELRDVGLTTVARDLPGLGTALYGSGKLMSIVVNHYVGPKIVIVVQCLIAGFGAIIFAVGMHGVEVTDQQH